MRIGHGYDVHRLVPGRKLILGGVEISFDRGLDGHSDADVLTHAIMDALLGAAGLGDIGHHFPDSDSSLSGINSLLLLAQVMILIENAGYCIGNIDATVIAQRPRLSPYLDSMKRQLCDTMHISPSQLNLRPPQKSILALPGEKRVFLPTASAFWKISLRNSNTGTSLHTAWPRYYLPKCVSRAGRIYISCSGSQEKVS